MKFEDFVGLRYLMAKRDRNMLSVITLISIGGVAVGVMALIVVLSVMGGFEDDFREKIIGTKAHIVIGAEDGYLENYNEIAEKVRALKDVVGVSPFVEAEVMLNSPTNLQGVILRGIPTDSILEVSELGKYMKEGSLNYLDDPDALPTLSLSGSSVRSGSMVLQQDHDDGEMTDAMKERLETAGAKAALAFVGGDHGAWLAEHKRDEEIEAAFWEHEEESYQQGQEPVAQTDETDAQKAGSYVVDGIDIGEDFWHDGTAPTRAAPPSLADLELADDERPLNAQLAPTKRESRKMPVMMGLNPEDEGKRQIGGIIPGRELKVNLNLYLGAVVNVMSPTGDVGPTGGMPKSRPFKMVGSYYSGMFEYDTKMAYISLSDAQALLNIGDRVSGIDVKIKNFEKSEKVRDAIRLLLSDYDNVDVQDWKTLNGSLFSALMLEKTAMFIILTFIVLVASFNILCLLIMMVIEKGREIAIFKAMGASNRSVVRIFVVQGAIIGGLGTLIGCTLGIALSLVIASLGLKFPGEVYYLAQIPIVIKPWDVVLVCLAAMGISLLATVLPSAMAAKLKPVDALRHD